MQTGLTGRGVVKISGADAAEFLQGLISNDIYHATETHAIFSALLTPQGKFLHDFFIIKHADGFLFDVERAYIASFIKRLSIYKLRSQVILEDVSEKYYVATSFFTLLLQGGGRGGGQDVGGGLTAVERDPHLASPFQGEELVYRDPRHGLLGWRAMLAAPIENNEAAYDVHRLALGIPDGAKDLTERSILLEWGYDHLNAIDFNKGCYVGQEVTARSKHRGALNKMIHQVVGEAELPVTGTKVLWQDKEIGEVRSSCGKIGLAILRVEEVEKAGAEKLMCGDVPIQAQLPPWIK